MSCAAVITHHLCHHLLRALLHQLLHLLRRAEQACDPACQIWPCHTGTISAPAAPTLAPSCMAWSTWWRMVVRKRATHAVALHSTAAAALYMRGPMHTRHGPPGDMPAPTIPLKRFQHHRKASRLPSRARMRRQCRRPPRETKGAQCWPGLGRAAVRRGSSPGAAGSSTDGKHREPASTAAAGVVQGSMRVEGASRSRLIRLAFPPLAHPSIA